MNSKTRKRSWPVSLVMALAFIGMMAAVVLSANPGMAQAQGLCDTATGATLQALIDAGVCTADGSSTDNDEEGLCDTATGATLQGLIDAGVCTAAPSTSTSVATFESSSTSANAGVELKLVVTLSDSDVEKLDSDGGSIELYLEDDFALPDSINRNDVYFTVAPKMVDTGDGGRVRAQYGVVINDGDYYGGDDDWAIQVFIPDLQETVQASSNTVGAGFQGPTMGDTITMVITTSAGIKNPTEAGTHSVGYRVLGVNDAPDKGTADNIQDVVTDGDADPVVMNIVKTVAKISLSVDNGGRGKEVTITGSGFNNGVDAEAFVLVAPAEDEDADPPVEAPSCTTIVDTGESLGTATVGSDDKFTIAFTVHQDEFKPGKVNYVCAKDSEAGNPRQASAVKTFDLTASISLDPTEADSGDEVTLKARDFGGPLTSISLGPDKTWTMDITVPNGFPIKEITNNNMDYTFDVPGGLSGVIQVDAKRGSTRKTASLTITPSSLTLNQTEVAPNQSIIISGSGFNDRAEILTSKITIDGKMLKVDDAGTEGSGAERHVSITSSGQFTVTVNVWHDGPGNPALDADEYTIKVTDSEGYEGKTKITISEPTIMVTPQVAGPRDFITISGANWPVTTSEDDYDVSIEVDGKTRTASIDSSGRFRYEYRLSGGIGIGEEHDVKVTFTSEHRDKIEEETTFSVPSSNVVITPAAAAPGQTIDLEISGMPIGELVSEVTIDGGNRLGGINLNTDRNGDVTITGIVVPYSEPGFYPVKIEVGTGSSPQIAIVQLEILAEPTVPGTATALPGALEEVDDSLVRVFYFNTASKVWTFFDPRDEFADLNTLTELSDGQPYWILVNQSQENVVLNGQTRDLTCVGGDCWNQLVW